MRVNPAGIALIKRFEGLRLEAYVCPAGVLTIGYGHTGDVKADAKITEHQADIILRYDLERFEACVTKLCPSASGNQFSAMVCLAFNVGEANFKSSSVVTKFNGGGPLAAAPWFDVWNKARVNGVLTVLPGLTRRRAAERELFLTPVQA